MIRKATTKTLMQAEKTLRKPKERDKAKKGNNPTSLRATALQSINIKGKQTNLIKWIATLASKGLAHDSRKKAILRTESRTQSKLRIRSKKRLLRKEMNEQKPN